MAETGTARPARPARRRGLSFATQTLLLQLGVVVLVVASTAGVFTWLTYDRLVSNIESRALVLAQAVAAQGEVRSTVTAISDSGHVPSNAQLRVGPMQQLAESFRAPTHALFVVITNNRGIRLSHPTLSLLGKEVSTSPDAALHGQQITAIQIGTLGPSARAKVPIFSPQGSRVVGEVSVGFSIQDVVNSLKSAVLLIAAVALGALVLGFLASTILVRRLRTLTLGLEPEEISALVQDQEVVLYGVDEGVIGIAADGRVTVCNARATRLLALPDAIGRQADTLGLPDAVLALLDEARPAGQGTAQVVAASAVLLVTARKVVRASSNLGWVLTVLDRTRVEELTQQLDAVGALTAALRVQRHEFANHLHTAAGLLTIGDAEQARAYLSQLLDSGPLEYPVEHGERLRDPYLQAFVGAKGFEAAERGVALRVGQNTLIRGGITEPGDVTTVLGNLIDNAVRAAVHGTASPRWVELELLSEAGTLHLVVADSGDGVHGDPELLFAEGRPTAPGPADDPAHGHGIGLPLSRRIARLRGGDLWLASPGRAGGPGAIFCARLPEVLGAAEGGAGPDPAPTKGGR